MIYQLPNIIREASRQSIKSALQSAKAGECDAYAADHRFDEVFEYIYKFGKISGLVEALTFKSDEELRKKILEEVDKVSKELGSN